MIYLAVSVWVRMASAAGHRPVKLRRSSRLGRAGNSGWTCQPSSAAMAVPVACPGADRKCGAEPFVGTGCAHGLLTRYDFRPAGEGAGARVEP